MQKGFQLHVQSLRVLRMNGFLSNTFKKGVKPIDLYPLPLDNENREKVEITQEQIKEFQTKFSRAIPVEEKFSREEFLEKINKK